MQDIRDFKDKVFAKAKLEGFEECEIYLSSASDLEFTIYQSDIDTYSLTETIGVSFRGIYNGKMGYSYTEKIEEDSIEVLIDQAKDTASSIQSEDEVPIYEGDKNYAEVQGFNEELENVPVEDQIKFSLDVEKFAKERDSRVKSIEYNLFAHGSGKKVIMNTKGLDKSYSSNNAIAYISVVTQQENDIKTASKLKVGNDFKQFDARQLANDAVDEAISMLGAEPVKSGNYPIIFRNTAMADMIITFMGIFSAESVQKGLSLLKDKVGTKIASEKFTLVDDPLMENGINKVPFDDEGVATYKKSIIENGELKTLLYNLKTAKKDGVKSTGNGQKGYKSAVGTAPFNMYVEKGTKSFDELVKQMGTGIVITEVEGLHAGANAISGDFSLSASGYYFENGNKIHPVEQVTVSDNFYKILENIDEIADDLEFTFPSAAYVGSPSILIKGISVAGK